MLLSTFKLSAAALALPAVGGTAFGAFYMDCAACHAASATSMSIIASQSATSLKPGCFKVLKVTAGQTAAIQLNVTNSYGAKYALSINNLGSSGLKDSSHHLVYDPDPAWTNYFPGTGTNFFLAGPSASIPAIWTFRLTIRTNTPPDLYLLRTQVAGYDSSHRRWSQPEDFYLQVVAGP